MLSVRLDEIVPMDQFELNWRWTNPSHSMLPQTELIQIRPLAVAAANRLHPELGNVALEGNKRTTTKGSAAEVASWLHTILPSSSDIAVFWSSSVAVLTTTEIFADRWSSFCYPSSDDLVVVPLSLSWQLEYNHWEEFVWSSIAA